MSVDQVDPLISEIYRWMDVSGVLLMGIIGGTLARHRGYDIVGFFFVLPISRPITRRWLEAAVERQLLARAGIVRSDVV